MLATLHPETILEVGCGRGRIAAILRDHFPDAAYTGLDVGQAQLKAVAKVWPGCETIESPIQHFKSNRRWDLVIASEVLLHIPPDDIQAVCDKLRRFGRTVLTIDWTEPVEGEIAPWNWLHEYRSLFGPVNHVERIGLQSMFVLSGS